MNQSPEKDHVSRIDREYLLQELRSLYNLEKGYLFTVYQMFWEPGRSIQNYLRQDRGRLIKPLIFLFFNAFAVVFFSRYLIDQGSQTDAIQLISHMNADIRLNELVLWKKRNMGYVYLGFGVFMAGWIRLFFRKFGYNIYEILVTLAYLLGQGMLIILFSLFIAVIFPEGMLKNMILLVIGLFYYGYILFALVQFFGGNRLMNFFKLVLVFILSGISFLAFQVCLVLLADHFGWMN